MTILLGGGAARVLLLALWAEDPRRRVFCRRVATAALAEVLALLLKRWSDLLVPMMLCVAASSRGGTCIIPLALVRGYGAAFAQYGSLVLKRVRCDSFRGLSLDCPSVCRRCSSCSLSAGRKI